MTHVCHDEQETHIAKLKANLDAAGDASLQNSVQLAVDALQTVPPYGHREVLHSPTIIGKNTARPQAYMQQRLGVLTC